MGFKAKELMIQVLPTEGGALGTPDDDMAPCENDTIQTRVGTAGPSGLELLRHQMRKRLSQDLPS